MPRIGIGLSIITALKRAGTAAVVVLTYITDKLVLYFNFAKESESDVEILGDNAAYTGHKTVQFGSAGSSYFGGDGDKVVIGDIDLAGGGMTLSCWVKPDGASASGYFVAKTDYSSAGGYSLFWNGGSNLVANFYGSGASKSSSAVFTDADNWVHVAHTVTSGGAWEFFRNGVSAGSGTGLTIADNNLDLTIGTKSGGADSHFEGSIANVGIWSRVLSQNEIQAVMRKGYSDLGTTEKQSLVGWWGLDSAPTKTLSLDGSGDFIDLGSGFTSALSTSHSWTMWVKFADGQPSGQTRFIGAKDATDTGGSPADQSWYLAIDNAGKIKGNFESGDNDAGVYTSSSVFPNGATSWTHIAMTCNHTLYGGSAGDGYGGIRIYANGVLVSPLTGTDSGDVWNTNFAEVAYVVNAMVGGQSIMGSSLSSQANTPVDMANLALYGEKLSAADVLTIYGQGITGSLLSVTGITNPINYWVMDDASTLEDLAGTIDASVTNATLVDSLTPDSTDNNSGSINGSTTTVSTYGGHAPKLARTIDVAAETYGDAIGSGSYSFDGSSGGGVFAGDGLGDSLGDNYTGDFSFSGWIKPNALSVDDGIFSIGDMGGTGGIPDIWFGNNFYFDVAGKRITYPHTSLDWTHLVCTYKSGVNIKMYVNGTLISGTETGSMPATSAMDFAGKRTNIGNYYNDGYAWNGSMSQIGFWSRELTSVEANSVMEKSYSDLTTADKVDLRGWWGLDTAPLKALDFDGSNYVDMGTAIPTAFGDSFAGPFSVSLWIRPDTVTADDGYFAIYDGDGHGVAQLTFWQNDGKNLYQWLLDDTGGYDWSINYEVFGVGALHHIVAIYDGSDVTKSVLYIDGVKGTKISGDADSSHPDDMAMDGLNLHFGRYYGAGMSFDGAIAKTAIWGKDMSGSALTLYNLGIDGDWSGVESSDLKGYWDMTTAVSRMSFDGSDDYVEISDSADTLSGFDEITIMVWVNRDTVSGSQCPIDKDYVTGWGINLYGAGAIHVWMKDTTGAEMMECLSGVPADGAWHLVTITYSHALTVGTGKVYIDDSVELTDTPYMGATLTNNTAIPLRFGKRDSGGGSNFFNGKISQGALWNKELTAGEISDLYDLGPDGDWTTTQASNLKGNWKLNHATTIQDLTAHNHDGIVYGATFAIAEVPDLSANSNTGTISGATLTDSVALDSTSNNNDGALI